MASTLMTSKPSCSPRSTTQVEGDEDEDDPRWELIRQLVEYKKFMPPPGCRKWKRNRKTYPRSPAKPEFVVAPPPPKPEVSLFD